MTRVVLPQPDFLQPLRPLPRLLWLAGATALAVLLVSGLDAWSAWQQRGAAQQKRLVAQARLAGSASAVAAAGQRNAGTAVGGAAPSIPQPGTTSPSATANASVSHATVDAVGAAKTTTADATLQQRLAYPWLAVWQAGEAASVADVAWLGLSHQAGHGLLLEGRAANPAAALAATGALRAQAQWQQVVLTRLERNDSAASPTNGASAGQALALSALPAWLAAPRGEARP